MCGVYGCARGGYVVWEGATLFTGAAPKRGVYTGAGSTVPAGGRFLWLLGRRGGVIAVERKGLYQVGGPISLAFVGA